MNPSIVDYLKSVGQPTDYASRSQLAASKGITGYTGSAQQNTQLLNMLRGGGTGAPIAQPPTATPTPAPAPSATSSSGGGDTELQQLAKTDRNPIQETRYQELLRQQPQTTSSTGLPAISTQPSINLPELYENLFASSGIRDIENELSTKSRAYNEQVAKIKDNPYLSEATMTGRLSKLQDKFNADSEAIRNDITMRKADIETKLNLQTKQFDINSNQVKLAWDQFNSLLSAGALDGASGEDIANLTRSTGISSSMIQSAIDVNKKKNAPKVSISQFDEQNGDTTNTYAIAVDESGNIVNRQLLGTSIKPLKATGGGGDFKAGSAGALSTAIAEMSSKISSVANSYGHIGPSAWQQAIAAWIAQGFKREDFIKNFSQYADYNRGDFEKAYGFKNPVKK